ncbi:MAG: V-type ATPase subunit [archaeon]
MISILKSSLAYRAMRFGYANARVKAMKDSLLSRMELNALVEAKSVQEIYGLLERTRYREDLVSSALKEKTLADQIELACAKNLSRTIQKIVKVAPEELKPKVIGLFEKYDINNIKTILASKHISQPKDEIENFIFAAGSISRNTLNRMLNANSVKEAVLGLGGTPYASVLEGKLRDYEQKKELSPLFEVLDDYYYKKLPFVLGGSYGDERIILAMVKSQVDAKNISTILRAKKQGMDGQSIMKMVIEEGSISKEKMRGAAEAKSVEEAARVFEKSFSLGSAIEQYKKTYSLIPIEMELEKRLAKKGLSIFRTSTLSVGAIAGFLMIKEEEINNIRKIVRAKEFNLSAEKLKEMIVEI